MKQETGDSGICSPVTAAEAGNDRPPPTGINGCQTLRKSIDAALDNYFSKLDGQMASDLYDLVLSEVEPPLLEATMRYAQHNQTRASSILGVSRGTLRKKLKQYRLI